MEQQRTLYAILGVDETADLPTLERAFLSRIEQAGEDASLLRVAYDTLRQPDSRTAYDRRLLQKRQTPTAVFYAEGEKPEKPARRPWLLVAFVLAGTAYWIWKTPSGTAARTAPPTLVAHQTANDSAQVAVLSENPAQNLPQIPALPPAGTPAASLGNAAPEPILARRPPRKAGFDPQYLAWSVFTIRQSRSSGSGVLIAPDKILTNCHVLAGAASNGMIVIHSQTQKVSKVEKYARLDGEDACLVFAPNAGGEPIEWGNSSSLKAGDTVHTFGHPGGSTDVIWSEGQYLARAEKGGDEFLLTANYCRPGSSGGPLLDDSGRLIGIVTAVQRYVSRNGEPPRYGSCVSLTESTARALLGRPLFPIALAPAQYIANY